MAPRPDRHQWEVWRFQRDQIYPDVITGMTKDRKRWVFITAKSDPKAHRTWVSIFDGRQTVYVQAIVGPNAHKPTVKLIREVEAW
jgi:hypothetical protein